MTAPAWMDAVVADFGRGAGLESLSLGGRGAAALRFETGASLRLEYTGAELVMSVTFRCGDVKRLLSCSHPVAGHGFAVRAAVLPRTQEGILAVRLAERDVTLPQMSGVFGVLWRLAGEFGGAQ